MPGDLHKLWRARDPKEYHVEYGYSCMGYEIAGGARRQDGRARTATCSSLVGDGSYLMMSQEIVTAVQEGIKLIVVLVQNHGFASIGALSESLGSQRFGTSYRYRDPATGTARRRRRSRSTWPPTRRAWAPTVLRAGDDRGAPGRAAPRPGRPTRTTVVHVETDPLAPVPRSRELVGRAGGRGRRARLHPAGPQGLRGRTSATSEPTCESRRRHQPMRTIEPLDRRQADHRRVDPDRARSGTRPPASSRPRCVLASRPTSTPPCSRRRRGLRDVVAVVADASAPRCCSRFRELVNARTGRARRDHLRRARQGALRRRGRGAARPGGRRVRLRHPARCSRATTPTRSPPASTCSRSASRSASCAGITPFNFPAMVPMWMYPVAIACGNTFVLKPTRARPLGLAAASPSCGPRPACPTACSTSCTATRRPSTRCSTTPTSRRSRSSAPPRSPSTSTRRATAHGKRVQALGGAKNHAIVLPDADLDFAADHLVAAAFGSAGRALHGHLRRRRRRRRGRRAGRRRVGEGPRRSRSAPAATPDSEMGPVITAGGPRPDRRADRHRRRARAPTLAVDGRGLVGRRPRERLLRRPHRDRPGDAPTWTSTARRSSARCCRCVRVDTVDDAIDADQRQPLRQRHRDLHRLSGEAARTFQRGVKVGMIGINVPVPVPMAYYSFGGWKDSLFGDKPHPRPRGRAVLHPRQGRHLRAGRTSRPRRALPSTSRHVDMIENLTLRHRARLLGRLVRPDDHQVGWKQFLDEIGAGGLPLHRARPLPATCRRTRSSCATSSTPAASRSAAARSSPGCTAAPRRSTTRSRPARRRPGCSRRWAPSTWCCCPSSTPTCTAASSSRARREHRPGPVAEPRHRLTTSSARSSPRSTVSSWCSTRTPTPTSTPRPASSGSCTTPTRRTSTCASTPGTSRYCDGDNIAIVQRFPERIGYVHLKQVDPEVRRRVHEENLSFGRGRPAGRHVRAAVRRARDAAAARRVGGAGRRPLRRRRAGPVPRRTAHPAADRRPHRGLPARLWARPGTSLALPILTVPRTRGTLDDEYPQVLAWSSCRCSSRPRLRRRLQQQGGAQSQPGAASGGGGGAVTGGKNYTIAMITHEQRVTRSGTRSARAPRTPRQGHGIDLKYSNDPERARAGHAGPERDRLQGRRHRAHPVNAGRR